MAKTILHSFLRHDVYSLTTRTNKHKFIIEISHLLVLQLPRVTEEVLWCFCYAIGFNCICSITML